MANSAGETVTLYPYGLVSRHGLPHVQGFYILHEGLIGVVDEQPRGDQLPEGARQSRHRASRQRQAGSASPTNIGPPRWCPSRARLSSARFGGTPGAAGAERFQTDYLMGAVSIPAGGKAETKGYVFAGAKEVNLVDSYAEQIRHPQIRPPDRLGLVLFPDQADVLRARLLLQARRQFRRWPSSSSRCCIKLVLFPLANKSYVSMSKMKKLAARDGSASRSATATTACASSRR